MKLVLWSRKKPQNVVLQSDSFIIHSSKRISALLTDIWKFENNRVTFLVHSPGLTC